MAAAQNSKVKDWTKGGKVVLIDRGASSGEDVRALPLKLGNLSLYALCRTAEPRARWCRPCVAPHRVYYAIDAGAAFNVPTASLLARLSKGYGSSKFERDVDFIVVTAITGRSAPTASVQASGQHSGRLQYRNVARRGVRPFFERDTAPVAGISHERAALPPRHQGARVGQRRGRHHGAHGAEHGHLRDWEVGLPDGPVRRDAARAGRLRGPDRAGTTSSAGLAGRGGPAPDPRPEAHQRPSLTPAAE